MEPGKAPGRSTPPGRSWGLRFPPTGSRRRNCRPNSSRAGRDKVQKGNKLIVINSAPYETRAAAPASGIPVESLPERGDDRNIIGNTYKGRVIRVPPGGPPSFVDIGMEKAGFLYAG